MSESKSNNGDFPAVDVSMDRLDRLADFFNEVGMLRHTPRTGYAFLGTGQENVAEHSYRVSVMGYVLARMCDMDPARVTYLCLFHDLHEARTGDLEEEASREALLAHDADQLDLVCNLKAELDKGNAFAAQWLESAVKRLRSPAARQVAEAVLRADHNRWWYGQVEREWWVRRGR